MATEKELYNANQTLWCLRNGVTVGSAVKVSKKVESEGCPYSWLDDMDSSVGEILTVSEIYPSGICLGGGAVPRIYSYEALEPVPRTMVGQLRLLADALDGKRSDISDILDRIIDGTWDGDVTAIESRYPKVTLEVEYDTLTTLFNVVKVKEDYADD